MFTLNGERWWIILVDPHDEALLMPDGDYALGACDDSTKTIFINNRLHGADFEQVLGHEIAHASMFAHNVVLSFEEEELIAEIISIFGEEIIDITDALIEKVRRGR